MSDTSKLLDLMELAQDLDTPLWGPEQLSIWGGQCSEDHLHTFLADWSCAWGYHIWEWTDAIASPSPGMTPPDRLSYLERGRIFGQQGDLDLRRDEAVFLWRFIGPHGVQPPEGFREQGNFWDVSEHQQVRFRRREEQTLLWGQRTGDGPWHENRVAFARLDYPVPAAVLNPAGKTNRSQRVALTADLFSLAGTIQFVWFKKLEVIDGNRNR